MSHRFIDLSSKFAWRPFALLGRSEMAFLAKLGGGRDFSKHEFSCMPGTTNFCAIRPTGDHAWSWTLYDESGQMLDEGTELLRTTVIRAAIDSQPLWRHRCAAKGECRCHRHAGPPP
jgi:hypothetical protein